MLNEIALKKLVTGLANAWLPEAVRRHSFIITEISEEAHLHADEKMVAQVIEHLIKNVIKSSSGGCIRISAEQDDRCTLLRVKDNQSDYSGYISGKITKVESLVRKIGGNVYYEFNRKNSLTVIVCFYHRLSAA